MQDYMDLRKEVHAYALKMYHAGMVTGSSGNVSARVPGEANRYLVTATSISYDELVPEQIVVVDGEGDLVLGENAPSFETPIHLAVYQARPDVGAVFHTHAVYSSVLAVVRRPIPPIIEELVPYAGGEVIVAEYGQSGTDALARQVVAALAGRSAILLANHGNLCAGKNLRKAFNLCCLVERAAQIYVEALKLGQVHLLPEEVIQAEKEMYEVVKEM